MRTTNCPEGAMRYRDAAKYLGMDRKTLRKHVKAGEVRAYRPTAGHAGRFGKAGVPAFFFKADLDKYLNSCRNTWTTA
jgi:excisionase family DNA binding protein